MNLLLIIVGIVLIAVGLVSLAYPAARTRYRRRRP